MKKRGGIGRIAKWLGIIVVLLSFFSFLSLAENLYQYDTLKIQLDVNGGLELVGKGSNPTVQKASAKLLLYPEESFRQELLEINPKNGEVYKNSVIYEWKNPGLEEKEFGYSAAIRTKNERVKVQFKVPFPLQNISGYEEYTLPTEIIDSDNPAIIAKAAELVNGEDDAFKVAFKLASWVEENVKYDLNTLTAKASQKASWVLENKEGVCDEMSSLFIAMARSLGIPAKFSSGISYTTSELFDENWQPHGWVEVYFPEIGWVGFDVAFGEYGYVDVTHIKLRESFDSTEPATKYEWLANDVELKAKELAFKVKLLEQGKLQSEEIQIETEVLGTGVNFGSYDLVKGVLKNTADYYAAATLQLAAPPEVEIMGRNKRTILLGPKEVKETYWKIKMPTAMSQDYWYVFPVVVYSEKNVSAREEIKVQAGATFYTEKEVDQLMIKDEEKSYSRKVSFSCNLPKELPQGEPREVNCTIKNSGNTNLEKINFCVEGICEVIDLTINQQHTGKVKLKADQVGWNKLIVNAENGMIDKKVAFEYAVLDAPKVEVKADFPSTVVFGEGFTLNVLVNKTSFSLPKKVRILVKSPGYEQKLEMEELRNEETIKVEMRTDRIGRKNQYAIITSWEDKEGKSYESKQEVMILGEGRSLVEKMKMFLNGLMGML